MPRSVSGNYTLPLPPVVPNTTIEAAWANTTDDDIAQALTDSLDRYGRGGMVAPFRLIDGTEALPAWAFAAETGTGMWRETAGILSVSIQGSKVGQWSADGYTGPFSGVITGNPDFSETVVFSAIEALDLTAPGASIVWRLAGTEEPPGLVLGRNGSTQIMIVRGRGGVSIENSTTAVQFFDAKLLPQSDLGVDLGSDVLRYGNVYAGTFRGSYGLLNQTLRMQSDTAGAISWYNSDGTTLRGAISNDHTTGVGYWSGQTAVQISSNVASVQFYQAVWQPAIDGGASLGDATHRWQNLYAVDAVLRQDTVVNTEGPTLAFNNRGTNGVAEFRRLGGIGFGSYRDVQDPSYIAGVYGANLAFPGTIGAIDFVVADDNGGGTNPIVSGNARFRLRNNLAQSIVPFNVTPVPYPGAVPTAALYTYSDTSTAALRCVSDNGGVGSTSVMLQLTGQSSEPGTYNIGLNARVNSVPGYPQYVYDWTMRQYNHYNGTMVYVQYNGRWDFVIAIGNGVSDAALKSNWSYAPLDFVDKLALLQGGTYDLTIPGTGSPGSPGHAAIPGDPSLGTPATPASPALPPTPPPVIRQIGITAQDLETVMPDAVFIRDDGYKAIRGGDAALVAAVALAKRIKAIEAFVGM